MQKKKKHCFVIGPIGKHKSDDRTHADILLRKIIRPTFTKNFKEYQVVRADDIARVEFLLEAKYRKCTQ
jgi:hypothetical protein